MRLELNALLDDSSSLTVISSRAADILQLKGPKITTIVSGTGGNSATWKSNEVVALVESTTTDFSIKLLCTLSDNPTTGLQIIDWNKQKAHWPHFKDLDFPKLIHNHHGVEMLIGNSRPECHHRLLQDIEGNPGEPAAALTRFGWTAIGYTHPTYLRHYNLKLQRVQKYARKHTQYNAAFCTTEKPTRTRKKAPTLYEQQELDALNEIQRLISAQWEVDTADDGSVWSPQDQYAIAMMEKSRRFVNGQYQIATIWKKDRPDLPNNRAMAQSRFQQLNTRLSKKDWVAKEYCQKLESWKEKGYLEPVPPSQLYEPKAYYLPHFPVVRPDKSSTKVRPVMDAAAKTRNLCLNDALLTGPNLINNLVEVLTRMRKNPVMLGCDIKEMYKRILLPPEDKDYHRIFWFEDPNDPSSVKQYRFTCHVFGNKASPNVAIYVIKKHAEEHKDKYPLAADIIQNSTIIDDALDSFSNLEDARNAVTQLTELLGAIGMKLHKWLTNYVPILDNVPEQDRCTYVDFRDLQDIATGGVPSTKALGMILICHLDKFTFEMPLIDATAWAKRLVLKCYAKLYDPVGFIAPFIVQARLFLQTLWKLGVDWDEKIKLNVVTPWLNWLADSKHLSKIRISRCLRSCDVKLITKSVQIHVFSDASDLAYGCVAYQVTTYENSNEITANIIMAKVRVAPLQKTSIPRLELMGAALAVKMASHIVNALKIEMKDIHFWTDSQPVLHWICNQSRNYSTFIGNRISYIQNRTPPANWHWVPTKENPADCLSRGQDAPTLVTNTLWWQGPEFLLNKENWPSKPPDLDPSINLERKKGHELHTFLVHKHHPQAEAGPTLLKSQHCFLLPPTGSESETSRKIKDKHTECNTHVFKKLLHLPWNRYLRVIARIRQAQQCFKALLKKKRGKSSIVITHKKIGRILTFQYKPELDTVLAPITPDDLTSAADTVIKLEQTRHFQRTLFELKTYDRITKKNPMLSLNPKLDTNGLLRMTGRLRHATHLSLDKRCPVLIPKTCFLAKKIIEHTHAKILQHIGGPKHIMAELNTRYWVLGGTPTAKATLKACIKCRQHSLKTASQQMAPLPDCRTQPASHRLPVFHTVGIDCAGPFKTIIARKAHKRYFVVFVCCQYRAVHLEALKSLSTQSFLCALTRFMARRGTPQTIISDNGTNFVGANNELMRLWATDDETTIRNDSPGINWQFNTPYASHTGGHFERLVQMVKHGLYKQLNTESMTDEQFETCLCIVEDILNSRPIGLATIDGKDHEPLTPRHFLSPSAAMQAMPSDKLDDDPAQQWQHIVFIMNTFWKRYSKECVPLLNRMSKWHQEKAQFKINDIVAFADSKRRGKWPLAKVVDIKINKSDKLARSVEILTTDDSGKTVKYWRSIRDLIPLPSINTSALPQLYK